jgi:hypothetical protein
MDFFFRFHTAVRDFFLFSPFPRQLLNPASLQIGVYRDNWSGLKRPEDEADSSPPCRAELFRMSVPIPLLLLHLYGMCRPIYLHPFVIMAKISCLSLKSAVSSPLYALNNFTHWYTFYNVLQKTRLLYSKFSILRFIPEILLYNRDGLSLFRFLFNAGIP